MMLYLRSNIVNYKILICFIETLQRQVGVYWFQFCIFISMHLDPNKQEMNKHFASNFHQNKAFKLVDLESVMQINISNENC